MACVPTMATPLPPLDPNAINTSIALTSAAAATQTIVAIPPTPTFTSTPRSTFTPEPTSTAVPTVIFPTSTLVQRLQLFRVKHDTQLAEFNYQSRTAAESWPVDKWGYQTPEVFNMFLSPKMSSGTNRTELDSSWEQYLNALNGNDKQVLQYLKADWTALFDGQGFPYLESKTMGGNVISVDQIQGDWVRVHTIDFKEPGSLKDKNYITNPDIIHKMVVVKWDKKTKTTVWGYAPQGPMYWPLVSDEPVWMPLKWLEPFPQLPMTITIYTPQPIRVDPSLDGKETGKTVEQNQQIQIIEYKPSGSSVWARIPGEGWIALYSKRKFLTSWSMQTLPPP
jgi:hypothetical protein